MVTPQAKGAAKFAPQEVEARVDMGVAPSLAETEEEALASLAPPRVAAGLAAVRAAAVSLAVALRAAVVKIR